MLAVGSGSAGLFYVLLVLHVAAALTGFASIGFAGTYAGRATRLAAVTGLSGPVTDAPGEPADEASGVAPAGMVTEELVRYFKRPAGLWWALLAVPWLGLGALAAEPHGGGVGQAWDLAAFGLWAVAAVVAALVVVPSLHRVGAVLVRPAPGLATPGLATPGLATPGLATPDGMALDGAARARVARSGLVASRAAAVCDVLFFMALALMIWQP
jgi:hypothetical protein